MKLGAKGNVKDNNNNRKGGIARVVIINSLCDGQSLLLVGLFL